MIQGMWRGGSIELYNVYVDLLTNDLTVDDFDYRPLFGLTSQLTGKSIYVIPYASGLDLPALGFINLATSDYPLGFYDFIIYNNSSNSNLDPAGLTPVYYGLFNAYAGNDASQSTLYTAYTSNDTDTESVYLTARRTPL